MNAVMMLLKISLRNSVAMRRSLDDVMMKMWSPISVPPLFFSFLVPPSLTVPRGKSPLVAREGDTVELECLVSGKPKPIILWSRADKEAPMPDGSMQMESYDGVLRIVNVSREMTGSYRCQTSQYNGFNVKPREAIVELIVQYPPTVEPVFMEMRQGLGRPVVMTCRVLRAHPSRVLRFEWLLSNRLLHAGAFDAQKDETEYTIRSLNRDGWGEYTCNVINEAGAGKCTFQVTGKDFFKICAVHSEALWSAQQWEEEGASQSLSDPSEEEDQQRPQTGHHGGPPHAGSQRDLLRGDRSAVHREDEGTLPHVLEERLEREGELEGRVPGRLRHGGHRRGEEPPR
ncbi:MAM domain-containing glycosylphosphatidylinositol anchor protein 2-like [Notolabrus celidotus]|uniref:MAM domain-containing glycosylphosphatidylinositol anchor protein 2-like n=1 Tax=Notolabrus celidotus TaxID=1203425 RepID=UPI00148F72FF|nr:MAM domain-containing glycosylphosphatidylinositol anchor protein 2-like [Notolabrus celidotus]